MKEHCVVAFAFCLLSLGDCVSEEIDTSALKAKGLIDKIVANLWSLNGKLGWHGLKS
jgi:hypothetical protein